MSLPPTLAFGKGLATDAALRHKSDPCLRSPHHKTASGNFASGTPNYRRNYEKDVNYCYGRVDNLR